MRVSPAALSCLLLLPAMARAEEKNIDIRYEAPAACVQEAAFRLQVLGRLSKIPESAFFAKVVIHQGPEEFLASIETSGGRRKRQLRAPSCEQLVDAAATVVALAVDPTIVPRAPDPIPTTPPDPCSEAPAPATGKAIAAPPPPILDAISGEESKPPNRRSESHFYAHLAGLTHAGLMLDPGLGVSLSVGATRGHFGAYAELSVMPSQTASIAQVQEASISLSGFAASFRATFDVFPSARFHLGPALGISHRTIRAWAEGIADTSPKSINLLALDTLAWISFDLNHWLRLRLGGGVSFALGRQTISVNGLGVVYRFPLVGGIATLGPEVRF
jgi:hypothetical protein